MGRWWFSEEQPQRSIRTLRSCTTNNRSLFPHHRQFWIQPHLARSLPMTSARLLFGWKESATIAGKCDSTAEQFVRRHVVVARVGSRLVRLRRSKGINSLCMGLSHAMAIYNRVEPPRVVTRSCGIPIWPHILCSIFNEVYCGDVSWKCRRLANPHRRYYRKNRQIQLQSLFNSKPRLLSWVCFTPGMAVWRAGRLDRFCCRLGCDEANWTNHDHPPIYFDGWYPQLTWIWYRETKIGVERVITYRVAHVIAGAIAADAHRN